MSNDESRLFDAFIAGFATSGEGWNGEYPFSDKRQNPRSDPDLKESFRQWLKDKEAGDVVIFPGS